MAIIWESVLAQFINKTTYNVVVKNNSALLVLLVNLAKTGMTDVMEYLATLDQQEKTESRNKTASRVGFARKPTKVRQDLLASRVERVLLVFREGMDSLRPVHLVFLEIKDHRVSMETLVHQVLQETWAAWRTQ